MTADARVAIAAGGGLLARRPRALMFVPAPDTGSGRDLLELFVGGVDDVVAADAVTDALVTGVDVGPFVLVQWHDGVRVVVFGDIELRTDRPELSMISGAGSTTWVERRLGGTDDAATVEVTVGDDALAGTDVGLGNVLAGGFRATLVLAAPSADATGPADTAPVDRVAQRPASSPSTTPLPAPPPDAPPAASPPPPAEDARQRGLEALQFATGGDWMEDSLGLRTAGDDPADTAAQSPPVHDDEVTLAPEDLSDDLSTAPAVGAETAEQSDERAVVRARLCGRGHANPVHALRCRACHAELDDVSTTAKVPQPTLAALRLPDGSERHLDRTFVLGRRPDLGAAQLTSTAARPVEVIEVGGDAAISRTHVAVSADEWTITVTDCGSRSGTAIVAAPGDEPATLEPWVPHEAPVGATIYLGGPTAVSLAPHADTGNLD